MQRLDWQIDYDGSMNAWADNWQYQIIPYDDAPSEERIGWWQLCCTRDKSEDSKWFLARYLEDAMALAAAIAAGVEVE